MAKHVLDEICRFFMVVAVPFVLATTTATATTTDDVFPQLQPPLPYLTYTMDCTSRARFRVPVNTLRSQYDVTLSACDSVAYSINTLLDKRDSGIYSSLANSLIKPGESRSPALAEIRTVSVRIDGRRYNTDTSQWISTSTTANVDDFTEDFAGDIVDDFSGDSVDDSCACSSYNRTESSACTLVKSRIMQYGRHSCTDQVPLFTYSIPLYSCVKGLFPTLRGSLDTRVSLANLDVNQCDVITTANSTAPSDTIQHRYRKTHRCPSDSKCVFTRGHGMRRGGYDCLCPSPRSGGQFSASFRTREDWHAGKTPTKTPEDASTIRFNGSYVERVYDSTLYGDIFLCSNLTGYTVHKGEEGNIGSSSPLLFVPLVVQSFSVTVSLVISLAIVRMRNLKVVKYSKWILLEIIIFGCILLYSTVIIQYLEPTSFTCILIPWIRELGFAVVYGGLLLRIYRTLTEFQSRKAHRVQIKDRDMYLYHAGVVVVVVALMTAWTASQADHVQSDSQRFDIVWREDVPGYGEKVIHACAETWWQCVIELCEFTFLGCGIYGCYCVRSAITDYREARYISWAIYNETLVSALFNVSRHLLWWSLHPHYIYILYFLRCQITVTATFILVIGPKLWYTHRPPEISRSYSGNDDLCESLKLRDPTTTNHVNQCQLGNGDLDCSDINISDMNPEDIRTELNRLYTQLQLYKTKTLRKDNPHISKRRGGRKQTHRRFSLQAFHHKHVRSSDRGHPAQSISAGVSEIEHELSKTPEESTNSDGYGTAGLANGQEECATEQRSVTFRS